MTRKNHKLEVVDAGAGSAVVDEGSAGVDDEVEEASSSFQMAYLVVA